jgi:hypothetical protein
MEQLSAVAYESVSNRISNDVELIIDVLIIRQLSEPEVILIPKLLLLTAEFRIVL